jgi:hypothetical protein
MLQKFERKIGNWCYRWLTLGGQLTLLKFVLESHLVYWMSLEIIPLTVLNHLRKIMFNFLWKSNSDSKSFHLCKWERLTLPKCYGGWGLRNLIDFNKALVTHTLWRVLKNEGIWHTIIVDKYLPHSTVNNWYRSPSFIYSMASRFWRGLLKTTQWITQWLSWSPERGQLFEIDKDHILGMGNLAIISPSLIEALNERNIFLHIQIRSTVENRSNTMWLTNEDLNLHEDLGKEWNLFWKNLIDSGALIQDREDELIWSGDDNSGIMTVKNIYLAMMSTKGIQQKIRG